MWEGNTSGSKMPLQSLELEVLFLSKGHFAIAHPPVEEHNADLTYIVSN